MLESDESSLNEETTSSVFRMIEEQTKATYATLTTLQPLSPAASDSGYTLTHTGSFADLFEDGFAYRHGNVDDLTLAGYEFLEPLVPIAVFDGDAVDCDLPASTATLTPCSLFARTSFLTPTKREKFDRSLSSLVGCDTSSLVSSSRASSPELSWGTPHNGTTSPLTIAKLTNALTTVITTEEFEAFMDTEKVDTRDIAELVSVELRKYNIPQALFAQRVLGRSQGTLSDLLRNPKPWTKLKTGRETFGRMWQWLQAPDAERLQPLNRTGIVKREFIVKSENTPAKVNNAVTKSNASPISSAEKQKRSRPSSRSRPDSQSVDKKPRMIFTDDQRDILMSIFQDTPKPNRELQMTISDRLGLPVGTVSNFFMNARRRDRYKQECGGVLRRQPTGVGEEGGEESRDDYDAESNDVN